VAEEAIPVYSPIRPRTMANTLLAAVVGAMLAVGIILLVEYLDDTVKTPEDLASVTDLSTLGAIADIEGRTDRDRLVTLLTPRSAISEAYRMLRTNIQFAAVDGQVKSIMVTSSGSGEGKSTTAANLAIVMAQTGRRVILIDADLRRPIQHRLFELPNSKGLTMALLDLNAPPKEHLQVTPVPGLQVMTSGAIPPNPAELLGSQRQADLLADLEKEADLIILDSPPVLTVADALVLAPRVGGVLLVVEVGSTRRGAIQKAVDALLHADARLLGVALNRLTLRRSAYYYHYYQQYYRQYEEGEKDSSRRRSFLPGFKR
jgi:non-specific protein-tyrosine kinase